MTPSLPTFSIASAMMRPISMSLFEATLATFSMSFLDLTGMLIFLSFSVMSSTAFSMPRFISIGLAPETTERSPSLKMASASTVAVVVPSPAVSLVLLATSRTMRAPMFSYLSSRSISLATVTPSLVTVGEPKLFWRMTLRPLGPSVTLTARASLPMPLRMASRASWSKAICLAGILPPVDKWSDGLIASSPRERTRGEISLVHDGEDVFLAHDEQAVLARALPELVAGPGGEQDGVAGLDLQAAAAAVLEELAGAGGQHLALLRLVLGGVGQQDAARRLL